MNHSQDIDQPPVADGTSVSITEAIDRAAELLSTADYPLIYGLSRSTTPGQRAAVDLAEQLRGVADTTASLCHGPSIMAIQEVGEVTSTLGEIRNRADLVIFWGCNPAESHPRHTERYSVFPAGKHIPNGRADRTIVMVGDRTQVQDWRLDADRSEPDLVIGLPPGEDFEAISQLQVLLNGDSCEGIPDEIRHLIQLMKRCRYGVVFFGLGLAKTSMWDTEAPSKTGHIDVAALLKLVAELNQSIYSSPNETSRRCFRRRQCHVLAVRLPVWRRLLTRLSAIQSG